MCNISGPKPISGAQLAALIAQFFFVKPPCLVGAFRQCELGDPGKWG